VLGWLWRWRATRIRRRYSDYADATGYADPAEVDPIGTIVTELRHELDGLHAEREAERREAYGEIPNDELIKWRRERFAGDPLDVGVGTTPTLLNPAEAPRKWWSRRSPR
jgi:hypothetical protein